MLKSFALFTIFCFVLFEQSHSQIQPTQSFDCTSNSPFFTPFCSNTFYQDCNSFVVPQEISPITNNLTTYGVCSSSTRSGYYGLTFQTNDITESYYYPIYSVIDKTVVFNFKLYDDCPLAIDLPVLSNLFYFDQFYHQIMVISGVDDYFDTSYQYLFSMNITFNLRDEIQTSTGVIPLANIYLTDGNYLIQNWELASGDPTYKLHPTIPNVLAFNIFYLKNDGANTQLFFLYNVEKFSNFILDLRFDPNYLNVTMESATFSIIPVITLIRWEGDGIVQGCLFLKDNQFQFFDTTIVPFGEANVLPNKWYTFGFTSKKIDVSFQYTIALMEEYIYQFRYLGISSGREIFSFSNGLLWRIGPINGLLDNIDYYDSSTVFSNETFAENYPTLYPSENLPPPFNITPNSQYCANLLVYIPFDGSLNLPTDNFTASYLCSNRIDCSTTVHDGSLYYGISSFEPKYSQGVNINLSYPQSLTAYSILFYYKQIHIGVSDDCEADRRFPVLNFQSNSSSLDTGQITAEFTHAVYIILEVDFIEDPLQTGDSVTVTLFDQRVNITVAGWTMGSSGDFIINDPNFATLGQFSRNNFSTIILLPFVQLTSSYFQILVEVNTNTAYEITLRILKTNSYLRLENAQGFPLFAIFNENRFIYANNDFIVDSCLTQLNDNAEWSSMLFTNSDENIGTLYYDCSDNFSSFPSSKTGQFMREIPSNIRIGPVNGYIDQFYLFDDIITDNSAINGILYCVSPSKSPMPSKSLSPSTTVTASLSPEMSAPSSKTPPSVPLVSRSPISVPSLTPSPPSPDIIPSLTPNPPSPGIVPSLTPIPSASSSLSISVSISLSPGIPAAPVQISPEISPSTSPSSSIKVTPSMPPPIDTSPNGIYNNNNNNNNDNNVTAVATFVGDPSGTAEIPGIVTVSFTSQDFDESESNPILTINLSSDLIINQASSSTQQAEVVSTPVNILLFGATISNSIEICFPQGGTSKKDSCLGYIDETQSPPVWKCEDRCLKSKNDNLCGKTKHLTNFALLLGGLAKGGDCSDNYGYILGTSDNDIALVLSVAGFVVLLAIIFCLLFSFTPLRKLLLGTEGARIHTLRQRQSELQSSEVSSSPSTDVA